MSCLFCGSLSSLHRHHVGMQSRGSTELVTLCANHHRLIHQLAELAVSQIQQGLNPEFQWPEGLSQPELGQKLVSELVQAMLNSPKHYKIILNLTKDGRQRLERLKLDLGMSSLEKTVKHCLDLVYYSRFI